MSRPTHASAPGPYQQGRRARDDGKLKDDCPHTHPSPARTAWIAGWGHRDMELNAVHIAAAASGRPEGLRDGC